MDVAGTRAHAAIAASRERKHGALPTTGRPVPTRAARCSVNLQAALHLRFSAPMTAAQAKLWLQKWRWYERNTLPWNRARIHWEMAKREAFVRWPVHGNVLEALLEGRLEVGAGTLFEPGVWITAPGDARVRIGEGSFLNLNVMVASVELVEIGSHCMFANGCFVTDGNHRFDDREPARHVAGLHDQGAHARRRQRVVRGQRRHHQRRDDRRALCHRGQLGRHRRRPGRLDRRRLARPRAEGDHMGGQPRSERVVSYFETMT